MKMQVKIIQVSVDKLQLSRSVLHKVLEDLELAGPEFNKHQQLNLNNNPIYLVDHQLLEILFNNQDKKK